jgi:hypothetical protein
MSHNETPSHREIILIREEIGLIEKYRVQTEDNLRRLDAGGSLYMLHNTDPILEDLQAVRSELAALMGSVHRAWFERAQGS